MKKIPVAAVAMCLGVGLLLVAPSAEAASMKSYRNCTALNKVYPGGVARRGAKDRVTPGVKQAKAFTTYVAVYNKNRRLDRDRDGIACERFIAPKRMAPPKPPVATVPPKPTVAPLPAPTVTVTAPPAFRPVVTVHRACFGAEGVLWIGYGLTSNGEWLEDKGHVWQAEVYDVSGRSYNPVTNEGTWSPAAPSQGGEGYLRVFPEQLIGVHFTLVRVRYDDGAVMATSLPFATTGLCSAGLVQANG